MVSSMLNLMATMFILMAAGFILRKCGIIPQEGKKYLTDLILYLILPCNIIKAFAQKIDPSFFRQFLSVLAVAVLVQILSLLLARFLYNGQCKAAKEVYQYGTVCSNSSFMGNPLAESIFGNTGLVYATVFLIPQRIVMWTAGVSYFQHGAGKEGIYKKVFTHPCMLATYLGLVIMVLQLNIPQVLLSPITACSNCTTAMTMVYLGTILVDVDLRHLVDRHQLYFAFIRLIGIPLLVFAVCRLIQMNSLVTGVCTLLSSMPAGSTTSLLAAKYHADELAAAKCVVFTTALSIVTIPIWSLILTANL